MNASRIGILLACFWVIGVASTATAGPMHSHAYPAVAGDGAPINPHALKAVSPFEKNLGDKRIHCELLGHNPLLPCPHHKVPAGGNRTSFLNKECGGGPFQAPSSRSFAGTPPFLVHMASAGDGPQASVNYWNTAVFYDSLLSHSIDRPPRSL